MPNYQKDLCPWTEVFCLPACEGIAGASVNYDKKQGRILANQTCNSRKKPIVIFEICGMMITVV